MFAKKISRGKTSIIFCLFLIYSDTAYLHLGIENSKNPKYWFTTQAMGKNTINKLIKTMCQNAGSSDEERIAFQTLSPGNNGKETKRKQHPRHCRYYTSK